MKKIPNPTEILSVKYKVKYNKALDNDKGESLLGQIDHLSSVLCIVKTENKVQNEKTWLHEVLHGVTREININLTEGELDTLANVLYDVFTRNKCDFSV
jgi:hypothetical protein